MSLSPIIAETSKLREALWEQKVPNLTQGIKCYFVLERLQSLMNFQKQEGILHLEDLKHVYTVLTEVKYSFIVGLERVKQKGDSFQFFNPSWGAANTIREEILFSYWSAMLDLWVGAATQGENRGEAAARILEFLQNENRMELDLSGLKLKELPDIFRGEIAEYFIELYVSENSLTSLPESIGRLSNLEKLGACDNLLETLPESMKDLSSLKELYVSGNKLTNLSTGIMKGLGKLQNLDISYNDYISLPEGIENLRNLENLYVHGNCLTTLPESIGRLRSLRALDATYNAPLASLPNSVLQLPYNCEIEIQNCGFSDRVIANLRSLVNAPGYSGPRISFSIQEESGYETKTLEKALEDLCETAHRQVAFSAMSIQDESKKNLLEMWLNRICEIADYKSSNERKEQIANQILDYLEEASINQEFREVFYEVIADATRTCGDRVALSLLHIGLAYDEIKIDLRDAQSLAQFLIRGVFVMSILEEVARAKIPTLRLVDEIEVYLGYPVLLKERLQIPINIEQMLYARCSGLTEQDLSNAEIYVKEQVESKDAVCSFLLDQPRWQQTLEVSFPAEIANLKEERMARLEETPSRLIKIGKKYKNGLTDLTKKLIDWESLS